MKKIHTKMKRKFALNTKLSHYKFFHPGEKIHRPRTFSTEDAAKKWAEEKGIKEYELKSVKKGIRFQIVPKTV
jgi:hypothetical protein